MNLPIIKLEIQGMRHTIATALSQHSAAMDADVQREIEAFCSEGSITRIIQDIVRREVTAAVTEEVQNFFRYSRPGRQAIREAVQQHLDEQFPLEDA